MRSGSASNYDGQLITAGTIIVRQRGTHFHPGHNVGLGRDDTCSPWPDGTVKFGSRKGRRLVDIIPKPAVTAGTSA